jgi:hypothetical protein
MSLLSRQERERHRNRPSGALSQADNPGQLVFKADCSCPKKNCERHGYCEPCRDYHGRKGKLPRCER